MESVSGRLAEFRHILDRRQGPVVYVVTDQATVLSSSGIPPIPPEVEEVARAAYAVEGAGRSDGWRIFLLEEGLTARVATIDGPLGRYSIVLVEPFRSRDFLAAGSRKYALTHREYEVVQGVMAGSSTAAISAHLGIAESTVAGHIKSIMAKTKTRSRAEMLGRIISEAAER